MKINNSNNQLNFTSVYLRYLDGWQNVQKCRAISNSSVKANYKKVIDKEVLSLGSRNVIHKFMGLIHKSKMAWTDVNVVLTGKEAKKFANTKVKNKMQFLNEILSNEVTFKTLQIKKVNDVDSMFAKPFYDL